MRQSISSRLSYLLLKKFVKRLISLSIQDISENFLKIIETQDNFNILSVLTEDEKEFLKNKGNRFSRKKFFREN
jgi:hypothetical protein